MQLWQVILWASLCVCFLVAEAASVQLVAIWFAAGGLIAFILALCGASLLLQIIAFVLVSAVLLVFTRPIVHKLMVKNKTRTNADQLIGKECLVREAIDNLQGTGRVFIDGLTWSARCEEDGQTVPEGTSCTVCEIRGVKLIVRPVQH